MASVSPEIREAAKAAVQLVRPDAESDALVLDARDPLAIARQFVADRYTHEGIPVLRAWRGDLRAWTGTHYAPIEDAAARSAIYSFLEAAQRTTKNGPEPFRPNAAAVTNVLDALRGAAHLDSATPAPAWLDGRDEPRAGELVALANGLLHLPTRKVHPHTPALFGTMALPFAFEENPPPLRVWLDFLDSLWHDDPESITALQEAFGYVLAGATRLQKLFLLVGPKRSGKGTIARVLQALMGPANVAGPTLSSLAGTFGLQSLIDKPLAIVSDARLSGRTDQTVIVERLLSISGEDVLTVDRKHWDAWTGPLPTRFLILTNELPRLADTSGALASRFVVLTMKRSWYGCEDTSLFDRLVPELPAILAWSLDGLDRLLERGRFNTPASSADAITELEDLGSPVAAFVRECCVVEPGAEVPIGDLYAAWRQWCESHGRDHPGTEATFGRDLRAAVPGLTSASRRSGQERWRAFVGIRKE